MKEGLTALESVMEKTLGRGENLTLRIPQILTYEKPRCYGMSWGAEPQQKYPQNWHPHSPKIVLTPLPPSPQFWKFHSSPPTPILGYPRYFSKVFTLPLILEGEGGGRTYYGCRCNLCL